MKHIVRVLMVLLVFCVFYSCIPEESAWTEKSSNKYVNDWILKEMKVYYYWKDKLPETTDETLAPDDYFESLLYRYNVTTAPDGDRFSWIQDNWEELVATLNGVESHEIGFDYVLYLKEAGSTEVVGQVTYTKRNTPAEALGIRRGMMFDKVNGTYLTTSNYRELLLTLADAISLGFLNENYTEEGTFLGVTEGQEMVVPTVANYSENPVYLDTVYSEFPGHTVGYVVYNFFAADGGTGDAAFDLELNRVFGRFKTAGITDLIVDLRYNSGGASGSAELLASLVVPNLNKSNLYTYYEFNDMLNEYYLEEYGADCFKAYFTESVKKGTDELEPVNNVGNTIGGRVVVLTGEYTASASEQVINGLKPYMDVILVGDTTYGKNVASFSIYKENDKNNRWGMQPIVAKYFNKKGESNFTGGFAPDFNGNDIGMPGVKPLGDVHECLLYEALVVLGIINKTESVGMRSFSLQSNKFLWAPSHRHRGLEWDKSPLCE